VPEATLVDESVKTPVFEIVASPDILPNIGSDPETPRRICPSVPRPKVLNGLVPDPITRP